ncbi:MAG: glycerophosphodiester phosphodiesterase [Clostridia bacterium]|nr:glycerophosphodiester phosphodiesterase [Clostridia bacterium]
MFFLILLAILVIAYLFLIAPRMSGRPDASALLGVHYAHRGLHDNAGDAPENSMAAIRDAVAHGYGIEFDVQLTRDRIPVVFHDESLKRMCGVEGNVRDYTYEELRSFPLLSSRERIPLFADVLEAVDGKVPLIIEIKIHENAAEVCARADELISAYKGPYCIESFDPRAVAWYRKNRPQVIRGQLSCDFNTPKRREPLPQMLVHYLLTNVIARPDFIAYDHKHKGNVSRVLCRKVFRALSVAWTIKSQQELDAAKDDFDLFIFEQFIPKS